MKFKVAARTDIGLKKNSNQDSFGARIISTQMGKMVFAILCDGMGGLSKGEVASGTLVNAFLKWADERLVDIVQFGLNDEAIKNEWEDLIQAYNQKILLYGKNYNVQLGTTITAILLTENRYYVVNVGDSRAYEISSYVHVLTEDHTVIQREMNLGNLTEEQAKKDPRRSVLLQCVGVLETVRPDYFFGQVLGDTTYVLCSDGFRHEISEAEIFQYLSANQMQSVEQMEKQIEYLIHLNKERQEQDNISALAIRTFN